MHVPVAGIAAKQKESRSTSRKSTAPGTLVSGVLLHVHADQTTVELSNGKPTSLNGCSLLEVLRDFVGWCICICSLQIPLRLPC